MNNSALEALEDEIFASVYGHLPTDLVVTDADDSGVDDWEGPMQPEYSESDFEAYDEMVREESF